MSLEYTFFIRTSKFQLGLDVLVYTFAASKVLISGLKIGKYVVRFTDGDEDFKGLDDIVLKLSTYCKTCILIKRKKKLFKNLLILKYYFFRLSKKLILIFLKNLNLNDFINQVLIKKTEYFLFFSFNILFYVLYICIYAYPVVSIRFLAFSQIG